MIAGVILAGGLATRMGGGDKPLRPLAGRPMLAHVIARVGSQVDRLALNANADPARFASFGLPVLADDAPGHPGPLAGVLAGMEWAAGLGAERLLTVPGDAPFLPGDLVARLAAEGGLAAAETAGRQGVERHPTVALWPVAARAGLRAALAAGQRRVRARLEALGGAWVRFPDPNAFLNVNTPADLARAEALLSRRFDLVLVVDWSARASPSPARRSADSVWIGGDGEARYFRTRAAALSWIADRLAAEQAAGRRALVGFDFPFGYPRGLAAALTGRAEGLAVWALLAELVTDGPENANNRFAVAAALNARLPGGGPFWGRPPGPGLPSLPERRGRRGHGHGFPAGRLVEERVRAAQSPWKLYTAGSVGGQMLTGLPALERLRRDPRLAGIAVWPFETGLALPIAPIVLAEVYPSLLAAQIRAERGAEILDAAQVRVTARALAALDAAGGLGPLFGGAADLTLADRAAVAREEAWMLGAGHEAALRAAAQPQD